jgi:hypothetical protein
MSQRTAATPTQTTAPFFSSFFGGGSNDGNSSNNNNIASSASPAKSRPGTSAGEGAALDGSPRQPNVLHKDRDRRPSFSRKASFSSSSPSKSARKRTLSSGANGAGPSLQITAPGDNAIPPLPDFALAAAAKLSRESEALQSPASIDSFSKMLSRTAPTPVNGYSTAAPGPQLAPPAVLAPGQPSELSVLHQNIQDTANKRISTFDYLRKA